MNTRIKWSKPAKPRVTVLIGRPASSAHQHCRLPATGDRQWLLPAPTVDGSERIWQHQLQELAITEDSIVALLPEKRRPGWVTPWFTQTLHWSVHWHRRPLKIRCLTVHCLAQALAMRRLITESGHPGLDRTLTQARERTALSLHWHWQRTGRWSIDLPGGERRHGVGGWWLSYCLVSLLAKATGEILLCDKAGNLDATQATQSNLRPWLQRHRTGSLCVTRQSAQYTVAERR